MRYEIAMGGAPDRPPFCSCLTRTGVAAFHPPHNLLWLTYPSSCSCTVQRPCMRIGAARGERAEACARCGGARGAPSVARPHVASGRAGSPPKRCRRAAARRSRGVAAPRPLPLLEGVEVGGRHRRAAAPLDGAQVERLHALLARCGAPARRCTGRGAGGGAPSRAPRRARRGGAGARARTRAPGSQLVHCCTVHHGLVHRDSYAPAPWCIPAAWHRIAPCTSVHQASKAPAPRCMPALLQRLLNPWAALQQH